MKNGAKDFNKVTDDFVDELRPLYGEKPEIPKKKRKFRKKKSHKLRNFLLILLFIILAAAGVVSALIYTGVLKFAFDNFTPAEISETVVEETPKFYSNLTGELLATTTAEDAKALNKKPLYCIQIPNGMDGARPQIGLNKTAVVFEAVAEAGITRFAAIFQPGTIEQTPFTIGPIRSLRQYYLDWDTPLDCTIVHAGGSPDAIASVRAGNYRDLSESLTYMWRDHSEKVAPNNLFTSTNLLTSFNKSQKYTTSNPKVWNRYTPDEEAETLSSQDENTKLTKKIAINFNSMPNFNTVWTYDKTTNTYKRAYASGIKHETYTCPNKITKNTDAPTNVIKGCKKEQVEAKNLAVIMVSQSRRAGDKKLRTDVATTGKGKAYIFMNGQVVKATWTKKNQKSQIVFTDKSGNEIKFNPGRLWISAVPTASGSVKY